MAFPVLMPQVGQDLTEGVVIEISVKVGDLVNKGDTVAVVESEKASFEVEAYEDGTVLQVLYKAGDTATVLEPLMFLGEAGESVGDTAEPAAGNATQRDVVSEAVAMVEPSGTRSSPLARRLAKMNGLDIEQIQGTGPKGSVVKRDVEQAKGASKTTSPATADVPRPVARPAALPPVQTDDREEPFGKMRQVIADRLVLSKQTIPHFYLQSEVDVTDLLIRRQAHLDMGGDKFSVNDVIVQSVGLSLMEFPRLNAHVSHDRIVLKGRINVGVAVSVEDGLMVPAIADTAHKSVLDICDLVRDYAAAARRGISKSQAVGTFSISNTGMFGVQVLPIINPPEAGILGVGPIKRVVCEYRGGIQVRSMLPLSLSADHRAIDGAYGAAFLSSLGETISRCQQFSDDA